MGKSKCRLPGLRTGLGKRLRHGYIDAVATAVSDQQASNAHAMTNEALQRCDHVHKTVAARPKSAVLVVGDRNRAYALRSCCGVENPAATFPGGETTHNTDQSAVRNISWSVFGDDLDADGRFLGQFRGA